MKVKLHRSLGVLLRRELELTKKDGFDDEMAEGQVVDVPDDVASELVKRKVAEFVTGKLKAVPDAPAIGPAK